MVSLDRVYQKVLALANKEQRGYITPQEFNLFADHAQMEIFEQYFYDISQLMRTPGNNTVYSDPMDIIEDKIAAFEFWAVQDNTHVSNIFGDINLAQFADLYRVTEVMVDYRNNHESSTCEEVTLKEFRKYSESPLTKHTTKRPVFMHYNHGFDRIKVYPPPPNTGDVTNSLVTNGDPVRISYTKRPISPNWGYVVVNNKPLYNSTSSIDFELHASEEAELVHRILLLAGVAIEKPQLTQIATGLQSAQVQQEKQ